MYKQTQIEFAQIELIRQEVFYIKLGSRITLELSMAKEMIDACNQLLPIKGTSCGYIIDMSGVAFVTEDARNFITNLTVHKGKLEAVALVSNNHLGNIISTLMISFSDVKVFPMQLFKKMADAENWIQSIIVPTYDHVLKTA